MTDAIEPSGASPGSAGHGVSMSELLESRHDTLLEWVEPFPACGPEGNELTAYLVVRATVHDCINMRRAVAKSQGQPTIGDDARHLNEFMVVHIARVVS